MEKKKVYSPPQIKKYGSAAEITQANSLPTSGGDGGSSNNVYAS